jgi:hypothetical protein
VEKESIATRASTPRKLLQLRACTDRDLGQRLGVGIGVDGAIGKQDGAVLAELGGFGHHQEDRGDGLDAGGGADHLKGSAQHVAGGIGRPGHGAAGIPRTHHHRSVVEVVLAGQQLLRLLPGEPFFLAQLDQLVDVGFELRRILWLEQGHTVEGGAQLLRLGLQRLGIPQQHNLRQSVLDDLPGGLNHPVVVPLGQDDGLQVLASFGLDLINQMHVSMPPPNKV